MRFPTPLISGRLVQRYKRFLADVILDTCEMVTATCPNTGSMMGLVAPGSKVWLSISDSGVDGLESCPIGCGSAQRRRR